jgi:excisionase family DNA binding protein
MTAATTPPDFDPNADETIDARGAASLLHCDPTTVEDLARRGELPCTKVGRGWLFVRTDLLAYLAQRGREEAEERRRKRSEPTPLPKPEAIAARMRTPRRRPLVTIPEPKAG